jgi:hypothetical protein
LAALRILSEFFSNKLLQQRAALNIRHQTTSLDKIELESVNFLDVKSHRNEKLIHPKQELHPNIYEELGKATHLNLLYSSPNNRSWMLACKQHNTQNIRIMHTRINSFFLESIIELKSSAAGEPITNSPVLKIQKK